MYRVVAHSEAVHGRPEAPSRPLAHMRMNLAGYDQNNKVADVSTNDGCSATICAVAQISEAEDYGESERGTNGGESIGSDAVESECPGFPLACQKFVISKHCRYDAHNDRGCVSGQRRPS